MCVCVCIYKASHSLMPLMLFIPSPWVQCHLTTGWADWTCWPSRKPFAVFFLPRTLTGTIARGGSETSPHRLLSLPLLFASDTLSLTPTSSLHWNSGTEGNGDLGTCVPFSYTKQQAQAPLHQYYFHSLPPRTFKNTYQAKWAGRWDAWELVRAGSLNLCLYDSRGSNMNYFSWTEQKLQL